MTTSPQLSVCQLTLPDTSFEEDIEICQATGLAGIGIDVGKIDSGEDDRLRAAMREHNLSATICTPVPMSVLPLPNWPGPDDPAERLRGICEGIERLAPFEPATVFVLTGPQGDRTRAGAWDMVVGGLREALAVAESVGVTLSLEPMRESFREHWTMVSGMQESVDLIEELGGGLQITYDTWHLWDSPDVLALTERYASHVAGVQVADYRDPTRGQLDRVLPGDGVIDFPAMIRALRAGGYEGWWDIEIFSDDGRFGSDYPDSVWKRDAVDWLGAGIDGFMSAWAAAQ